MRKTRFIWIRHFFPGGRGGKACLLVVCLVLCLALKASYGQTRLNMKLEQLTVTEALKRVSTAVGYEFFYNADQLAKCGKQVNAILKDAALNDALTNILEGTDFDFRVEENTIIVTPRVTPKPQSEEIKMVTLVGKVVDENKAPMVGVTVCLETETLIGTTTNVGGEYALNVPSGNFKIAFSFIGYEKLVKVFDGKNAADFFRIEMKPETVQMEDVVVTGIYQRKKESFTGSSTTFKA